MNHLIRSRSWLAVIVTLLILTLPQGLIAAPPSGGGGGKISVTAANPSEAFQGEELDVIVTGSGFDTGSTVNYLVTGTTDASQVEVLSVQFISSTQLKTRVRPKDGALPTQYDVEVRTLSGRKGKGTTLFRVKVAETACTGTESKEPTIAYTIESEAVDGVRYKDLMLSSESGCDQYLLVADLKAESIPAFSFVTISNRGIVTWVDRATEPSTALLGVEFSFDSEGNIVTQLPEPEILYATSNALRLEIHSDLRTNSENQFEVLVQERHVDVNDGDQFILGVFNIDTGAYEIVIEETQCLMIDESNTCFKPSSMRFRGPADDEIFMTITDRIGLDFRRFVRVSRTNGVWNAPLVIMRPDASDLPDDLTLGSVSRSGLMTYREWHKRVNNGGKVLRTEFSDRIIDVTQCFDNPCSPFDGVPFDGVAFQTDWAKDERLILKSTQSGSTLIELLDPISGIFGPLEIMNVSGFNTSK